MKKITLVFVCLLYFGMFFLAGYVLFQMFGGNTENMNGIELLLCLSFLYLPFLLFPWSEFKK